MQRSTFPLSLMTTMQPAREHYVQSFRQIRLPSQDGAGSETAGFEEPCGTSAAGDQRSPGVTFPLQATANIPGRGRRIVGRPASAVVPVIPELRHPNAVIADVRPDETKARSVSR